MVEYLNLLVTKMLDTKTLDVKRLCHSTSWYQDWENILYMSRIPLM